VLYLNRGAYQPLCNKLKRLGITCVFVAAKLTEVSAPSAHEFAEAAEVSTFTRSQLLLAERALLRELEYYLYHPTPSSFASAFLSATLPALERRGAEALDPKWGPAGTRWDTGLANEITEMVDYLLETAAVSHLSLDFPPSLLAAASVAWVLTRFYRVDASRLADLEALGGYGIDRDMREAFEFLEKLVKDARRSEKLGRGMNVNDKYPRRDELPVAERGHGRDALKRGGRRFAEKRRRRSFSRATRDEIDRVVSGGGSGAGRVAGRRGSGWDSRGWGWDRGAATGGRVGLTPRRGWGERVAARRRRWAVF
jgi:hypothetical protein